MRKKNVCAKIIKPVQEVNDREVVGCCHLCICLKYIFFTQVNLAKNITLPHLNLFRKKRTQKN